MRLRITALFAALTLLSAPMIGCGGDSTPAGDTTTGDTTAGDTTAGDTTAGDTTAGDTTMGDTTTPPDDTTTQEFCGLGGAFDTICGGQVPFCANWWAAAEPGTPGASSGPTQACYWYHLDFAATFETGTADNQAHCAHAMGIADLAGNNPCGGGMEPPAGACTNVDDIDKLLAVDHEYNGTTYPTLQDAASTMAQDCAFANIASVLTGDCGPVSTCVADESGLSDDCGACYAGTVCCVAANCQMCISDPDSAECGQCQIDAGCIADFYTCSGLGNSDPMNP